MFDALDGGGDGTANYQGCGAPCGEPASDERISVFGIVINNHY